MNFRDVKVWLAVYLAKTAWLSVTEGVQGKIFTRNPSVIFGLDVMSHGDFKREND